MILKISRREGSALPVPPLASVSATCSAGTVAGMGMLQAACWDGRAEQGQSEAAAGPKSSADPPITERWGAMGSCPACTFLSPERAGSLACRRGVSIGINRLEIICFVARRC